MNPLIPPTIAPVPPRSLTRNQVRGFWAAWGGWALDGMDSFIYALVLVPALKDLLPRSGIPATTGNVGYYGGLLLALFLIGWGLAFLCGPVADKFGRASAFAFATSIGRFAGAGVTFLVGAGVAHFQTIGTPVALTALAFVPGILLLPFGVETRGESLPL